MVEQSTAASHGLAREAEGLARLIGRFQIGEPAQAARAAPGRTVAPASAPAMKTVSTHAGGGGALRKPAPVAAPDADSWEEF
jgi:methyl-accepting chemotaxis protein